MTLFSSGLQTTVAFFHSKSKTLTEDSQAPYEALYKSSHSQRMADVWADVVAYCVDVSAAIAEAAANSAVTKYTLETMTEVAGSNGQSYYLDNAGTFEKPWIAPTDVPHATTSAPSYGFQANIYQSDNTLITPTEGRFVIDYYAGIVQFEAGYTPSEMGWGAIKITCYVYSGSTGCSSGVSLTPITVDSEHTAVAFQLVRCDASVSGTFSVHLPSSPSDGDIVGLIDVESVFGDTGYHVVLDTADSKTINGETSWDMDKRGVYVEVHFDADKDEWQFHIVPGVTTD